MLNKATVSVLLVLVFSVTGCVPRVLVRKSPGPADTGIRYYRPKPYLRIEPAGQVATEGKKSTVTPSDEYVAISLEYLPDFSEEYSIDVRPGLGSANVSIGLADGWNLTSINQELDSEFDDNVKAVAELAKAASGFIPTKGTGDGPDGTAPRMVVPSTNVPIGYYESVIGKDSCGRKRLYGWRYIGFLPFSPCPTDMCGGDCIACGTTPSPLYGIVFENGVMTFKSIDAIRGPATTGRAPLRYESGRLPADQDELLAGLAVAVRKAILVNFGVESIVDASLQEGAVSVELSIELAKTPDDEMTREDLIRSILSHEDVEVSLGELGGRVPEFSIK